MTSDGMHALISLMLGKTKKTKTKIKEKQHKKNNQYWFRHTTESHTMIVESSELERTSVKQVPHSNTYQVHTRPSGKNIIALIFFLCAGNCFNKVREYEQKHRERERDEMRLFRIKNTCASNTRMVLSKQAAQILLATLSMQKTGTLLPTFISPSFWKSCCVCSVSGVFQ